MGVPDGRPADRRPRRGSGRPPRRADRPGPGLPGRRAHPIPGTRRRRLATNFYRRTTTAKDARRIARRFRTFEDLILRFATRPDLDIFSNNQAERTIRPVKIQQRGSGGAWRTLGGLADFAIVESYLSTAAKGGITRLDALRDLFNGNAWQPPGLEPAG